MALCYPPKKGTVSDALEPSNALMDTPTTYINECSGQREAAGRHFAQQSFFRVGCDATSRLKVGTILLHLCLTEKLKRNISRKDRERERERGDKQYKQG